MGPNISFVALNLHQGSAYLLYFVPTTRRREGRLPSRFSFPLLRRVLARVPVPYSGRATTRICRLPWRWDAGRVEETDLYMFAFGLQSFEKAPRRWRRGVAGLVHARLMHGL